LLRKTNRWKKKTVQAFGLVEVLTGLLITSLLLGGAYKLFASTSRKNVEAIKEAKANLQSQKVLEKIAVEIGNVVIIPDDNYDDPETGTVLRNKQPSIPCEGKKAPSGIIPYPGYTKSDLEQQTDFSPIDPSGVSLVSETDSLKANDAIRMVYLTQDSQIFFLANKPLTPESQINTSDTPEQYFVLEKDSVGKNSLSVGDFILISDTQNSDLVRITKIDPNFDFQGGTFLAIEHTKSASIWNQTFDHDYGAKTAKDSKAFIQKVGVKTYALHSSEQTLYMDTHEKDDGFDPTLKTYDGSPALAHGWTAVATNIRKFQIHYRFLEDGEEVSRRTVRASEVGATDGVGSPCGNQLGFPYLQRINVVLEDSREQSSQHEHEINPENLRRGGGGGGSPLEKSPVYIAGAPSASTGSGGGSSGGGSNPEPGNGNGGF